MYEVILSLTGMFVVGILTFAAAVHADKRKENGKLTRASILSDYKRLLNEITNRYNKGDGSLWVVDYYYNVFLVKRKANRSNEVLYLERSQKS